MFRKEKLVLSILSIVYAIIGSQVDHPTIHTLGTMGWLGIFQLLFCITSWMKRGNQFISPYIFFLGALYVFSFGQSFLWALGLEAERTLIGFYGITIPEIFRAQVLTLIMLAFFHIGATYSLSHNKQVKCETINYSNYSNLRWIGWFLFLVSIVPYMSELVNKLILSMTLGYGALYNVDAAIGVDNWKSLLAEYCIPSVICLFISYKDNAIARNIILCFLLINIFAILLLGGRSNAVILIALLLILYNYLVKRFTKKWIIVGAAGALFLLQVLSFISNVRNEGGRSASIDGLKIENNAAVDAIAEMGGTMFCLIKTQELVPSRYDYRYGKSYAYAITTLIPNLGFWDIHPAKRESNLGNWLTDALGLSYGTGFSMCAEAYANFGGLGFIVFFFWGWFLAGIFGKIDQSIKTQNYALLAFLMILFWFFLKLPRNNFINLIRPIFFIAGPIYLFCTKIKFK